MNGKSRFVDYEPLSSAKGSGTFTDHLEDPLRPIQRAVSENLAETWNTTDGANRKIDEGVKFGSSRETWIVRGGHGISYAGVFLFTFLVYFRPYEFSPSLIWLSKAPFWVAVLTLVIFIPTQLGLENRITWRPTEVNLVLLLLSAGLISIPFATDPARAFDSFVDFFKVVLIFIVIVNVVRSERRLKGLILLVLLISFVLSIAAINDYRLGNLKLQGTRIEGIVGGLFENPNDLALHFVTMLPIAGALFRISRNRLGKAFYGSCALLMIAGVVATFSRGGFIGLIITLCVLAWRLSGRNKHLLILALPVILVLFFLIAPGGYGARVFSGQQDNGSADARIDDLKRSLFVAARHPLVGVGMDNYPIYSNRNLASHNAYTQVAAEIGLAGAIIYVMFMATAIRRLRRIGEETAGGKNRFFYLSMGLEVSIVGYMACSFFASVAYLWYVYYLVAFAVCTQRLYAVNKDTEAAAS